MATVRKVGVHLAVDDQAEGYYTVSVFAETDEARLRGTQMYRHLSWTEAVDVMLVVTDENRPGTKPNVEGDQLGLW